MRRLKVLLLSIFSDGAGVLEKRIHEGPFGSFLALCTQSPAGRKFVVRIIVIKSLWLPRSHYISYRWMFEHDGFGYPKDSELCLSFLHSSALSWRALLVTFWGFRIWCFIGRNISRLYNHDGIPALHVNVPIFWMNVHFVLVNERRAQEQVSRQLVCYWKESGCILIPNLKIQVYCLKYVNRSLCRWTKWYYSEYGYFRYSMNWQQTFVN